MANSLEGCCSSLTLYASRAFAHPYSSYHSSAIMSLSMGMELAVYMIINQFCKKKVKKIAEYEN